MPDPDSATSAPGRFPLLARVWPPLVGVLVAGLLAALASRPFRAFDTYFHLRFGEEFQKGWSMAHPGQLSSASTNDWAPTQWLAQITMAWLDDLGGTTALVALFAALVSAFAIAVHLMARRHVSPGPAAILTVIVILGCLPSLSLRPQVLSYLLMAVVVMAWHRAKATGRVPWWLIPLAWVWATSHGMWVLGVGASAVLAVATCVERRPPRATALHLLAVPVLMLVASCATPVGPRLAASVLLVNSRAEHFHEWRAPELVSLGALPVAGLLAAAVVLMVRRNRVAPYDIALLGLGAVFAIYSNRTLPLALVVLAAVVAGEIAHLRAKDTVPRVRRPEISGLAALGVVVVVLALVQPVREDPADDLAPFADRLAGLPAGAVVLTDRPTGALLLWSEPGLDIPLHGYGDVYTDAELDRYEGLEDLDPGWTDTLARLAPRAALLDEDSRLVPALEGLGWTSALTADGLSWLRPPPSD